MKSCSVFVLLSVLYIVSSASSWHPLHKRQDQGEMCEQLTPRICTNGYYEDYAYIVAECNKPTIANYIRESCRMNENGDTCGNFNLTTDLQQSTSACGSYPTGNTCSDECRSFLIDSRARYGCCVNYLNDTQLFSSFSYPLWSRCGVEPVTEECAPSPFIIPAEIDPTYTEEVLDERLTFRVLCRTEFLDDLRDLGESCVENAGYLSPNTHCTVAENGSYCSQLGDVSSVDFTVSSNCANTSICDPLCIGMLTNLTNMFGCCFINEFNSTSIFNGPRSYLSYEFWERCGLTSPGFCDLKFDNSPLRITKIASTTRLDTMMMTTGAAVFLETSVIAVLFATVIALI